jgi:hypothetical protein
MKTLTVASLPRHARSPTDAQDAPGNTTIEFPTGYYVYTISVSDVIRYVGKGKGLRLYSHMKEVRSRLKRDFKLESIGSRLQRNLTEAVISVQFRVGSAPASVGAFCRTIFSMFEND